MSMNYRRSMTVLLCFLAFSAIASAEPLTDLLTKIHTLYVATAIPVSILMLAFAALKGYASEHRRGAIWAGGVALVFVYNIAGIFMDSWIPAAT